MKKYLIVFILVTVFLFIQCKKDSNTNVTNQLPVLTTNSVSNITQTTSKCGGNITSDGGFPIIERGVCWSINQTPTIADNKTSNGTGIGSFTSSITGLLPQTIYYVRAYATNSNGTNYGNTLSFKTNTSISATICVKNNQLIIAGSHVSISSLNIYKDANRTQWIDAIIQIFDGNTVCKTINFQNEGTYYYDVLTPMSSYLTGSGPKGNFVVKNNQTTNIIISGSYTK